MFEQKLYVKFTKSNTYSGPFFTFEAAFSHLIKFQTDSSIETSEGKTLATWSLWSGLYKVGVKYKYLIVNNEYNKTNFSSLIGDIVDVAPNGAMVQEVEAAC